MKYITIQHGEDEMKLNKKEALKMELALNLISNKKKWIKIGDSLYDFHARNKECLIKVPDKDDYDTLKLIITNHTS